MKTTNFCFAFFVLFALCVAGCAKNEFNTQEVSGIVTVDGSPMEGINVAFNPKDSATRQCYGMTDAQGKFVLTIPGTEVGSGASPGEYTVTFSKLSDPAAGLSEGEIIKKFGGMPPSVNLLSIKYAGLTTTDIAPVKVEKGKKNDFTFELFSK